MPRCCVCGKEAEYLHHGLCWCEDHRSYVREKTKASERGNEEFGERKMHSPGDLGLEWI